MLTLPARLFLLLLLCAVPLARAGEAGVSPLEKTLRLDLWGASLNQAAAAVREQTGVEILFYRPDLPDETTAAPDVRLITGNVTLGTVMEALAQRFGFRFRVTSAGKIEVSRGYGWVGERQSLRFVRLPPIVPDDGNNNALRELLTEMVKPLPLLDGDFSLRFESYPLPKKPDNKRGTIVLPEVLADYLDRGLRCLSGETGDYPAADGRRDLFARTRDCQPDWEGLLSRWIRRPAGRELRDILSAIATQAAVAIVVRNPPEGRGAPLDADIERYTLGRICEILGSDWRLGKRTYLCAGALLFEGGEPGMETDSRTRELFWDGLAVAGFDVRAAVSRTRGAQGLTTLLRRDVFPGVWRDPVCSMAYSPVSGRLTAVAPINVMQALEERIRELGGE